MENQWLDVVLRGMLLAAMVQIWVVILVRVNGLRSFSKMTSFDFVMTVAVGSLLASGSQSTEWTGIVQSLMAIAALFLVQRIAARLRKTFDPFASMFQNSPVILMRDGEILEKSLEATRVAKNDLVAKLREANVLDYSQVRAVVLETTGDISVLHGPHLSEDLLEGAEPVT